MKYQKSIKNSGCQKGGVPAAPSGTATLLRLSPSHRLYPKTGYTPLFNKHILDQEDYRPLKIQTAIFSNIHKQRSIFDVKLYQ